MTVINLNESLSSRYYSKLIDVYYGQVNNVEYNKWYLLQKEYCQ